MRTARYPALVTLVLLWTAPVAAQDAPASAADPRHAQSRELATALQQALGSRLMAALGSGGPVAHIAHLGGMVVGWLYLKGPSNLQLELRYRLTRWRMDRMRRRFDVHRGGRDDRDRWIH